MSNYSKLKNSSITKPESGTDLGTPTNTYGNIHMSGNLVIGNVTATASNIIAPRINSISYPNAATAADPAGGETITINGNGFASGASVMINGSVVGVVSVVSNTQITFTSPVLSAGGYVIYVINSDGSTAIYVPGIQYSGTPVWSTSAGSLGTIFETNPISATIAATGDAPVTYSLISGSLPTGSTFGTSTGVISGTAPADSGSTLYSFRINAIDAQNQTTYRDFTLTINSDLVTWSSPADNASYSLSKDQAISTLSLSASSAAGKSITYTANALPTGLTLSGSSITGTPTVIGNSSSSITATASGTNRTATRTLNWIIQINNDFYFNNTTLLLNTASSTVITDASSNNLTSTVVGDSRASNFGPYNTSWSNYFDGTGDYLSTPSASYFQLTAASPFTMEAWIYPTAVNTDNGIISKRSGGTIEWQFFLKNTLQIGFYPVNGAVTLYSGLTVALNTWSHVAISWDLTTLRFFINGVLGNTFTTLSFDTGVNTFPVNIGANGGSELFTGYISNVRILKGTALYTSTFTPSSTPLTAIANTALLTCQSNRFIDNSTNNFPITKNGDTTVVGFSSFTETDTTTGSMYFDGTSDYLLNTTNSLQIAANTNFTVEFWIYRTVSSTVDQGLCVFAIGSEAADRIQFTLYGAAVRIEVYAGTLDFNGGSVPLNVWTHVAIVRSSSTISIYVNGSSVATATYTSQIGNTGGYIIGSNRSISNYITGYISNLRVVNGTALYTSTFVPPTTPLSNVANTSLLTLQSRQSYNNSQFQDTSTNKQLITRNGTPTQGTFSPFSQTGFSTYFTGSSQGIVIPNSILSGNWVNSNFTFEAWLYVVGDGPNGFIFLYGQNNNDCLYLSLSVTDRSISYGSFNGLSFNYSFSTANNIWEKNKWLHVAWVRNSTSGNTNAMKIFLDGVLVGTGNSGTFGVFDNSFFFNNAYSPWADLNGYCAGLRLTDRALYSGNFTPDRLTNVDGTKVLLCTDKTITDNSPNKYPLSVTGSPSIQAFTPFAPTDEYSTSVVGGSGYFVNSTDYLSLPANSLTVAASDFTIEAWIYPLDRTNGYYIFGGQSDRATQGGSSYNWSLSSSTGNINVELYVGGGNYNFSASSAPPLNAWSYVVLARTGGTASLFLNGTRVATRSDLGTVIVNTGSTTYLPSIAANGSGSSTTFSGYISNLRFIIGSGGINATLTTITVPTSLLTNVTNTKLLANFINTGIYDSTAKNDLQTVGNVRVSTTQAKWGTTSMYFDGTGDNLLIPNSPIYDFGTGNFTIEGWVYVTSLSGSAQETFVGRSVASGASFHIALTTGGTWVYYLSSNNSTWNIASAVSIGTCSLNNWQHIALVRNGTTFTPYLNGVAGTTTTSSSAIYWNSSSGIANCITVGGTENPAGTQNFFGYMDDIRITKGYARYTTTFTPPSAAFIAK